MIGVLKTKLLTWFFIEDDITITTGEYDQEVHVFGTGVTAGVEVNLYWDAVKADALPSGCDVSVADLCVNAGPGRAAKILQRVVGATADGAIGPKTLAMVHNFDPKDILHKYYDGREGFYRSLNDYKVYGRGWSRRNKETLEKALELLDG